MSAFGDVFAVTLQPRGVRDVDDERVVLWAALGLEDVQDSLFVEGVGPESIDRLGRDAEQPPQRMMSAAAAMFSVVGSVK